MGTKRSSDLLISWFMSAGNAQRNTVGYWVPRGGQVGFSTPKGSALPHWSCPSSLSPCCPSSCLDPNASIYRVLETLGTPLSQCRLKSRGQGGVRRAMSPGRGFLASWGDPITPIMQAGGLKGQVLSPRCPTDRPEPQLPSPSFLHFWSFLESSIEGRKGTKG